MVKLCICDLDGVVVDNKARFAKAEEAKKQEEDILYDEWYKMNGSRRITMERGAEFELVVKRRLDAVYWRTAFTPDLAQLDTLIDGASRAFVQINHAYMVYFLTSRPETMREATLAWIRRHLGGWNTKDLIMKPLSQQFVKTPVWKAGTIEVLARLLSADELLVVDDEHAQQLQADLAGLGCFKVTCVASLAEAVAKIGA